MPLVERYKDWKTTNGSFEDPHMVEFDHRIETNETSRVTGLANIEE